MGKRIIIPGADFSTNGIRTNNVISLTFDTGSTIPYKLYFLPTAKAEDEGVSEHPVLPSDAIENSVLSDSEVFINGSYVSLWFGGHLGGNPVVQYIKSISVNYNYQISDMRDAFIFLCADTVDLRGMNFADNIYAYKMFHGANIKNIFMPKISIQNSPCMFYNLNNLYVSEKRHTDFTFIKKMTGNVQLMFMYLKSGSADFSGIDMKDATVMGSMFQYCYLSEIDLSTWEINSSSYVNLMFDSCSYLRIIHLDKFNCTPTNCGGMFTSTPLLEKVFVTNCTSTVKTWLLARLNECNAGGSNAWSETTIDGKACFTHN